MAEFLPIIMFKRRSDDDQSIEPGGDNSPKTWFLKGDDLAQRSQELNAGLLAGLDSPRRNTQLPYLFNVKLTSGDTSKTRRSAVVAMFDVNTNNETPRVIAMRGSENLLIQAHDDDDVRRMASNVSDTKRNVAGISCVKEISSFIPEVDLESEDGSYKVKLVNYRDSAKNEACEEAFENSLKTMGIAYRRFQYAPGLVIYELASSRAQAKAVLDGIMGESIFSIQPMLKFRMTLDGLSDAYELPDIASPVEGEEYPTLGILDSGVEPIPHIAPWLAGPRWSPYPIQEQNHGHGTFVAGVALYGDQLEKAEWVGGTQPRIIDANVFPDDRLYLSGVSEDEIISNIEEALDELHDKAKVWNLSISGPSYVEPNDFSDFAKALDSLQDRYGVLICKTAGSTLGLLKGGEKEPLFSGADSVRALTVGSAAHEKGLYDVADVGTASPFSCKGPGPEFIIKPEVSHYGGNAGVNKRTGELTETPVHSFGVDGNGAMAVGTSFADPRVSTLAANVAFALDGQPDLLLAKTLVIHSANYVDDKLIPSDERVKELGFGVPANISSILSDEPYESTLVLRGTLAKGEKINILDFPMPPSLVRDGIYTGQIVLTLAYDPILDPTQGGEYCQSDIGVKFGSFENKTERDTTKRTIINPIGRNDAVNLLLKDRYSKKKLKEAETDFALRERMLVEFQGKYSPVKKYAVDLEDLTPKYRKKVGEERLWYLELDPLFRYNAEMQAQRDGVTLEQEFCLVITIRDPHKTAPVYNEVVQQLNANNFVHSPVRIRNQVRNRIGN